jgi:hypothetical protein
MLSADITTRVKPMPNGTVHTCSRSGSLQQFPTATPTYADEEPP